jgi:23S rRNA (cytidine2498-2'-O)-methyltransferase
LHPNITLVIPFLRFEQELESELLLRQSKILDKNSYYFLVENLTKKPIWAQEICSDVLVQKFSNKAEALKILKNLPNLGCFIPSPYHTKLSTSLRKDMRELKLKRIKFEVPNNFKFNYFTWTISKDGDLLISHSPKSQFPLGWHEFDEDKGTPPNRAYLKLWEVLTLNHVQLKSNDVAIDVGSCPGGWTWVLSQQISKVYSVDKAPLDSKIAGIKNVKYSSEDAFTLDPKNYADCTWLFSDIICTPQRLLELVNNWMRNSVVKNFVCTIKRSPSVIKHAKT